MFYTLILGRLLFGLFCGLVMSLNPLYIQEVSPTLLRGAFATLNQVAFASGILLGMVRRTPKTLAHDDVSVPDPGAGAVPRHAFLPREPSLPAHQQGAGGRGRRW
uniref:Solute carrier family 2, facilitated glucose transporter member 3-like n=1 Tax=Hippocampus comes TaxID=109280 RepID=A0A3Q2ZMT4_HIPCM